MAPISNKEVMTAIRSALNVGAVTAVVPNERVVRGVGPAGLGFPYIRMQPQVPAEDVATFADIVFQWFYISVIAVAEDADTADDISTLIHTALQNVNLNIGSGTARPRRQQLISYPEKADNDITYYHSGGMYRIGVAA